MTYHVVEGGGLEYSNYGPSAQFSTSAPLSRYGYAGLSVTPQTSPERHAHTTTVSHAGPAHDAGTAAYLRDRRTNTRLTSTVPGGIDFAPPGAGGRPKQPGRGVPRAGLMPDPAIPLEVIDILIDVFGNPVEPRMKMPLVPKPTPRAKKDRAARRRNQHKIKRCLKVWRSKKTKPNCPRPPSFREEDPGEPRGRTGVGEPRRRVPQTPDDIDFTPEGDDIDFGPTKPSPRTGSPPKRPRSRPRSKPGKYKPPVPGYEDMKFIYKPRGKKKSTRWGCWSAVTKRFVRCPPEIKSGLASCRINPK